MSGEFGCCCLCKMMSRLSFVFFISLQFPFTHLHPFLPADPQVAPGEETRHSVPGQVMDPALLPQLSHDGVYPGKARLGLRPLGQRFWVLVPGDAHTDGVALHLVEARVVGRRGVEELTPQQLAVQGERRRAVLLNLRRKNTVAKSHKYISSDYGWSWFQKAGQVARWPCGRGRWAWNRRGGRRGSRSAGKGWGLLDWPAESWHSSVGARNWPPMPGKGENTFITLKKQTNISKILYEQHECDWLFSPGGALSWSEPRSLLLATRPTAGPRCQSLETLTWISSLLYNSHVSDESTILQLCHTH